MLQTKTRFFDKLHNNELYIILFGVFALFISAQIVIPIKPVPITLQSVSVLFIGLTYKRTTAIYTVLAYILLGFCGLPVFAKLNYGAAYFFGPTGGYLVGFVAAVVAMTYTRDLCKMLDVRAMFATCLVGQSFIYFLGISWLSVYVGLYKAIMLGFVPFILSGIVKSVILSVALRMYHLTKRN